MRVNIFIKGLLKFGFNHENYVSFGINYHKRMSNRFNPNLCKSISKRRRKLFFSIVATRIHSCNYTESIFCPDWLPSLTSLYSDRITFQYLIKPLKNAVLSCIYLINEKNTSVKHGLNHNPVYELKSGCRVGIRRGSQWS